ncbi:MAG TPA: SDR family oxidoreductase [Steroidobacteraceae bacterium]|nr:SDR family oxidoreductase [Steroidobacteraceae bacterium]
MNKKVCVITGSSSGIGAASAILFSQRGWDVCVNYSRNPEPAEKIASACKAHGADVLVERADVADDAQCVQLAKRIKDHFGRCDSLVNNAGTTKFVDLQDLDGLAAADFQKIYAVNVIGAFQMTRAFAALLRDRPGAAVVNVSSIASLLGGGSSIAYVASKGALNALTLSLARVLGPQVRVNAVAPGMVDSPWLKNGLGPERFAKMQHSYESASALGTLVSPEDVAETIYYLSAVASRTTGEVHVVDGGRRLGRL